MIKYRFTKNYAIIIIAIIAICSHLTSQEHNDLILNEQFASSSIGTIFILILIFIILKVLFGKKKENGDNNTDKNEKPIIIQETENFDDCFKYEEVDGKIELTYYIGKAKKIEIPKAFNNLIISKISHICFSGNSDIEHVSFAQDSELEEIGYRSFADCQNLKSIELPYSLKIMGDGSFQNCKNLTNVSLNCQITVIPCFAFESTGIKEIKIPDSVEIICFDAFNQCENLDSINISENSHLTEVEEGAFRDCKIDSFYFPKNLQTIDGSAFGNTLMINFNIDSNNQWFENIDRNLVSKDHKTLVFAISIGEDTYILPSYIEEIGTFAFNFCSFSRIEIHEDSCLKKISEFAFNRSDIKNFEIPPSLEEFNGTIFSDTDFEKITLNPLNKNFIIKDEVIYSADGKQLIFYPPYKTDSEFIIDSSVTKLGVGAFFDNCYLEKLVIPDSVEEIDEFCVKGCASLKEIYIGKNVKKLGFKFCSYNEALEKVVFADNCVLEIIDEFVFYECKKLTKIEIPASVKLIDLYSFSDCENLSKVVFQKKSKLETIGDCAFNNTAISEISIPQSVKTLGCAFNCCSLNKISIFSKNLIISDSAFYGNYDIAKVEAFSDAVFEYNEEKIGINELIEKIEKIENLKDDNDIENIEFAELPQNEYNTNYEHEFITTEQEVTSNVFSIVDDKLPIEEVTPSPQEINNEINESTNNNIDEVSPLPQEINESKIYNVDEVSPSGIKITISTMGMIEIEHCRGKLIEIYSQEGTKIQEINSFMDNEYVFINYKGLISINIANEKWCFEKK